MRIARSGLTVLFFALAALFASSAGARAQTFTFEVCNQSSVSASVAISSLVAPGSSQWQVEGWWIVPAGGCQSIGDFPQGNFYYYAEETGASQNQWNGTSVNLCVAYPGPFDRIDLNNYSCQPSEVLRGFTGELIPATTGTFTWTLNP